ncbi:MAG TPA: HAD-IA family hydrolase [Rhizomicrobium sp.]
MAEAVIWDFGGVFTSSPFEAFNRYETERGLPLDIIRTINATNPEANAWAKFEQAVVDLDGFDRLFAEEAKGRGHHIPGRDVLTLLSGDFRPDVIEALRRVKAAGLKTGCITNNMPSNPTDGTSTASRSLYSREIMVMFDEVIESSKIGIRKPDPRIYQLMCDALKVAPPACVYLDDLGVNLKPAKQLGMTTIKVLSGPQAVADLEAATGLLLHQY